MVVVLGGCGEEGVEWFEWVVIFDVVYECWVLLE